MVLSQVRMSSSHATGWTWPQAAVWRQMVFLRTWSNEFSYWKLTSKVHRIFSRQVITRMKKRTHPRLAGSQHKFGSGKSDGRFRRYKECRNGSQIPSGWSACLPGKVLIDTLVIQCDWGNLLCQACACHRLSRFRIVTKLQLAVIQLSRGGLSGVSAIWAVPMYWPEGNSFSYSAKISQQLFSFKNNVHTLAFLGSPFFPSE